MKAKFLFNDRRYISPSKAEAEKFLRFWKHPSHVSEFNTTWNLTTVELAPSYGQIKQLDMSKVEYGTTVKAV
jgi:hypothetical protein